MTDSSGERITAGVLLIGDELLSGRTRDKNLAHIAETLTPLGIDVAEARVVGDVQAEIVAALNALRRRYTYVFTTGGIGPTHDDITADAVAAAFGVAIRHDPQVKAKLQAYFEKMGREPTEARLRMARLPDGAEAIDNPVSVAPGFRIGNVFVMAGVPKIMAAMLANIVPMLRTGRPVLSRSVEAWIPEGDLGGPLAEIQRRFPDVSIGSYPFEAGGRYGANIVVRSRDGDRLNEALEAVKAALERLRREGKRDQRGEI